MAGTDSSAATLSRPDARADEIRDALERALVAVDSDERAGSVFRAAGLALRLRLTDLELDVRVAASQDPDHHLEWAFGPGAAGPAKLELEMDSSTANAYLQGEESLAIGIARGRVRCSGESRIALLYVPALRLLCEPYRRQVEERYPHLALA